MDYLAIGDKVFTHLGRYKPVYGWAHLDEQTVADYLMVYTNASPASPVEVTGEHLLSVKGQGFVPAKSLQVGDGLDTAGESGVSATITAIQFVQRQGLFAPLTPSGTIMVHNISASCYINVQHDIPDSSFYVAVGGRKIISHHTLSHISLSPIRALCFGVSDKFCSHDAGSSYAWFVDLWYYGTKQFDQQGIIMQVLVLLVYSVVI